MAGADNEATTIARSGVLAGLIGGRGVDEAIDAVVITSSIAATSVVFPGKALATVISGREGGSGAYVMIPAAVISSGRGGG